jgi:hypothetical protein
MAETDPETAAIVARFEANGLGADAFVHMARPFEALQQRIHSFATDDEAVAYIAEQESATLQRVYGGDEAKLARGLIEIKEAATLLGMDLAGIDRSGVLADPQLHLQALLVARNVLKNRKPAS